MGGEGGGGESRLRIVPSSPGILFVFVPGIGRLGVLYCTEIIQEFQARTGRFGV